MNRFPRYMMATKAFHKIGEISSDTPDLCYIREEEGGMYVGEWVFGIGFINVHFPKETTHALTPTEVEMYEGKRIGMYGLISGNFSYDCGTLSIKERQ